MGLGGSAALAVAVIRAMDYHFDLGLSDERVNELAFELRKSLLMERHRDWTTHWLPTGNFTPVPRPVKAPMREVIEVADAAARL